MGGAGLCPHVRSAIQRGQDDPDAGFDAGEFCVFSAKRAGPEGFARFIVRTDPE